MNLNQLRRVLRQTLLLPILALGLVAAALAWQLLDAERAVKRIQLADRNIEDATLLFAIMVDEETGLRAFQVTGSLEFLRPYEDAAEPFRNNLQKLTVNLRQQGAGTQSLEALKTEHARWVTTYAEPIITTVQAGGDTRNLLLNQQAKRQMDSMRRVLVSIRHDQTKRRQQAVENWQGELQHTIIGLLSSALIVGLLIGIFARNQLHLVSAAFQRALNALRQHAQTTYDSEQRLRAILVSLSEGVVVCGLDSCVESMNPAAEKLSGWTQEQATGKSYEEVFPLLGQTSQVVPESLPSLVRRELKAVTQNEAFTLTRPDKTERTVDISGAPIRERNGALAGIVIVIRDSTKQNQTQAALVASEKLAVAGRLAATIAHEIHNPLDSVANLLYLMRSDPQSPDNIEFLDMAEGELSRATQISRALLGMYRESRTAVAMDLASLLRSVLLLLERRFIQGGVSIKTNFEEPAIVTGFPAEIRQVFTNLLVNAAEASPSGSLVTVDIQLVTAPAINGAPAVPGVEVRIQDNGSGVSDEVKSQLFQPFFSTKGEAGTGLGLWVSKGILDKHAGTVSFTSSTEEGHRGTLVRVFLPRGSAEWTAANAAAAAASSPGLSGGSAASTHASSQPTLA